MNEIGPRLSLTGAPLPTGNGKISRLGAFIRHPVCVGGIVSAFLTAANICCEVVEQTDPALQKIFAGISITEFVVGLGYAGIIVLGGKAVTGIIVGNRIPSFGEKNLYLQKVQGKEYNSSSWVASAKETLSAMGHVVGAVLLPTGFTAIASAGILKEDPLGVVATTTAISLPALCSAIGTVRAWRGVERGSIIVARAFPSPSSTPK